MVIGKRQLTGLVDVKQDIGAIWAMWKAQGKDTPWACALGVLPAAVSFILHFFIFYVSAIR